MVGALPKTCAGMGVRTNTHSRCQKTKLLSFEVSAQGQSGGEDPEQSTKWKKYNNTSLQSTMTILTDLPMCFSCSL